MEKSHYKNISRAEKTNWWYTGKREILLSVVKKLPLKSGSTVLDVGCGTGFFLEHLASELNLSCYGLEPERGFFRLASSRLPGRISNLQLDKFVQLSKSKQSLFPRRYDLITCLDTLEHIRDDQKAILQMARLVKPSGYLILYCPAYQFLWSSLDDISHHFRRYTKKELLALTAGSGLTPVFSSYSNFFLFPPILLIRFLSRLFDRDLFFDPTGLKPHSPLVNSLFYHLYTLEKCFLPLKITSRKDDSVNGVGSEGMITPPFGVSVLVIAGKPPLKL